jgi:hypothetical membrane protein
MKYLGWLLALCLIVVGALGIVSPDRLIAAGRILVTPAGLVGVAVLRVCVGMALIWMAPAARAPKVLQAAGAVAMLAGLVTPLIGVERAHAIFEWEVSLGTTVLRSGAAVVAAAGVFLAFAVSTNRPAARR